MGPLLSLEIDFYPTARGCSFAEDGQTPDHTSEEKGVPLSCIVKRKEA